MGLTCRQPIPINGWEALEAHTEGNQRILDHIAVVEVCPDSVAAMQTYRWLHQQYPLRQYYFVHTSRASLDIEERRWVGIRRSHAAHAGLHPSVGPPDCLAALARLSFMIL